MKKNISQFLDLSIFTDNIDIIGDIHGCYHTLVDLLITLGYNYTNGLWKHPHRKAIFIGDYIDRGIYIDESLSLIKNMVDNRQAIALLGNHEMNLIGTHTIGPDKHHLRSHRKIRQHHTTIKVLDKNKLAFWIEWFKQLPLFLDFGKIRLVHAAWNCDLIDTVKHYFPNNRLDDNLLLAFDNHSPAAQALRYILKGPELPLPKHIQKIIRKKYSFYRLQEARIKWWEDIPQNPTYTQATLLLEIDKKVEIDLKSLYKPYPHSAPIVIFGHYAMEGTPRIIRHNAQCVDFGAYRKNFLTAYRYNGENHLKPENLVYVPYNHQDTILPSPL